MQDRILIVTNFLLFQAGWFTCILIGRSEYHWLASLCVLAIVALHCSMAVNALSEIKLVLIAITTGLLWESLLVSLGLLSYPHGQFTSNLAPMWIVAMWALFATQLNVSMRWLKNRLYFALSLGAVGGPMAYLAGARMNAVVMPEQTQALLALSLGWAVLMPALISVSKSFDGFRDRKLSDVR